MGEKPKDTSHRKNDLPCWVGIHAGVQGQAKEDAVDDLARIGIETQREKLRDCHPKIDMPVVKQFGRIIARHIEQHGAAGLVVVGAMAMVMYEVFAWIEKRMTGWAHRGQQANV